MSLNAWSLQGKRALITGGTEGIGLAVAREFLDLGAHVAIVARDEERLQWRVADFADSHPSAEVYGLAMDLSYPEELGQVPAWLTGHWDGLEILVNNVGTNIRKTALNFNLGEYQTVLDANLTSCFELTRLCHPLLMAGDEPSVINVASVAGLTHLRTGAPYAMSKAAMVQLTRNLACEWADDGIRVNCVAPWYIETPLAEQVLKDSDYRDEVLSRTPMGRTGRPEEVAGPIAFLAMSSASYVTGQCLAIDGGFTQFGF